MLKLLTILPLVLLLAACGDGGADDRTRTSDEEEIRERYAAGALSLIGERPVEEIRQYTAVACRDGAEETAVAAQATVAQAFGDDAELKLSVDRIEFESAERANLFVSLTVDGEVLSSSDEDDPSLWVYEDGEWRSAENCAAFGSEDE